jgi:ribosomal protein S18 acetylase RimI-like enzyme
MNILKYQPKHAQALFAALKQDAAWDMFTKDDACANYQKRLAASITYVCYNEAIFCGYVRALYDEGIALYISELYVLPEWRNQGIGRALLTHIKKDFADLTVYALSDEDAYYEKLGYRNIGSVFEIHAG